MQIDVTPETERLMREEMSSGHFRSVDELITAGVQALREKTSVPARESDSNHEASPRRHIAEVIRERMSKVPPEIMAAMPKDGASQHDHYIYGLPKREQ